MATLLPHRLQDPGCLRGSARSLAVAATVPGSSTPRDASLLRPMGVTYHFKSSPGETLPPYHAGRPGASSERHHASTAVKDVEESRGIFAKSLRCHELFMMNRAGIVQQRLEPVLAMTPDQSSHDTGMPTAMPPRGSGGAHRASKGLLGGVTARQRLTTESVTEGRFPPVDLRRNKLAGPRRHGSIRRDDSVRIDIRKISDSGHQQPL